MRAVPIVSKQPSFSCVAGLTLAASLWLSACSDQPWNRPYPAADAGRNILYSSFSERPKHLDPAQSYSSNEVTFTGQIYEPPLQYHYLKRPYELIPLTATRLPVARYLDAEGNALPNDAPSETVAYSYYDVSIQPGIRYQPHPAFARDEQGALRYHDLTAADLADVYSLGDFTATGYRFPRADRGRLRLPDKTPGTPRPAFSHPWPDERLHRGTGRLCKDAQ